MVIRNIVLRMTSLAISVLLVLYVKYVYFDPDAVSVNIMLTTLLFSIFRSGFSFGRLSTVRSGAGAVACFTTDKLVLLALVFIYSQFAGIHTNDFTFALFSASVITLVYLRQYNGYTEGHFIAAILVSMVFPVQVITNLGLGYLRPGAVSTAIAAIPILYMSFDRYQLAIDRIGRTEVYYSMLLPAGGFSAVSIDGIDKPLYILIAKIVDSISSIAGFVVQGNLSGARECVDRYDLTPWFLLVTAVIFVAGVLVYLFEPINGYKVISAAILVNICWLVYSMFTVASLIRYGEEALKNIGGQFKCLGAVLLILYVTGVLEPINIIFALSASWVCSMLFALSAWKSSRMN